MTYNLYLDDERTPKTAKDWVVVRSYNDAIAYVVEHGFPHYISFDHDLGTEMTGYDFAKWLVFYDLDHDAMPTTFNFNVHSANPVGGRNIERYLTNYMAVRNREA